MRTFCYFLERKNLRPGNEMSDEVLMEMRIYTNVHVMHRVTLTLSAVYC